MPELKTFRAATLSHALAQVKKDLGPNAVIVKTRSYRAGTVIGLGGKPTVEIIASAGVPPPPAAHTGSLRSALARVYDDVPQRRHPVAVMPNETAAHLRASPSQPETRARRADLATAPAQAPTPTATPIPAPRLRGLPVDPTPADPQAAEMLRDELGSIKRMVGQLLRCSNQTSARMGRQRHGDPETAVFQAGGLPDILFAHYTRLIDAGVDVTLAETLVATLREKLTEDDLRDSKAVRAAVLEHLAELIHCEPVALNPPSGASGSRPHPIVLALIGPTGVGKTTTIAKLAADYALRQNLKVALVTADTYRIGAVDQLRVYAEIIGVPLHVAATPDDLAATLGRLGKFDLVLIDTAGRSPSDEGRVLELQAIIDAARPNYRALVLSASASEASLARTCDRFAALRPDRMMLTKLDEAVSLGVVVNTPRRAGLPVSHITTGQDVPDFIEHAVPRRLAEIALDGEIVPSGILREEIAR